MRVNYSRRISVKVLIGGMAATAVFALGAQAAPAQSATASSLATYTGADRQQRLIEGAKKEGELLVYTSLPKEDLAALTSAFEKKYGIAVKVWHGPSEKVLERTLSDRQANRFVVDVIETNGPELEGLHRENFLQEVKSPYAADLNPQAIRPHHEWIGTRLNVITLAYNTQLIKKADLPKTYQDLLGPKWKGKLGIEAEDSDWFSSVVTGLGEEKGVKLFRDIVATNGIGVYKGHTELAKLVASGEVPLALTVYNSKAKQMNSTGAPMNWFVIPPAPTRVNGVAVTKRAPHPNAALLFVDFMLSDAQQILSYRDFVPTSTKVISELNKIPLKFIDAKAAVDEAAKWTKLYDDVLKKDAMPKEAARKSR